MKRYLATTICPNLATNSESKTLSVNWREDSKCIITYSPNDGRFTKNNVGDQLKQSIYYDQSSSLRAAGNYYGAQRDYRHVNGDAKWCDSSSNCFVYKDGQKHKGQDICSGLTKTGGNRTITLYTQWVYNYVRIHYCWYKGRTAKKWNGSNYVSFSSSIQEEPIPNLGNNYECDTDVQLIRYQASDCNFRDNRGDRNQNPPQHYCIKKESNEWAKNNWFYYRTSTDRSEFTATGDKCTSDNKFGPGNNRYNHLYISDSDIRDNTYVERYLVVKEYQSSDPGC